MKKDILKTIRETIQNQRGEHFRGKEAAINTANAVISAESEGFGAMVHSSEPILRMKDAGTQAEWKQDLVLNFFCAALVTIVIALFCMVIYDPMLIPFALPGTVTFMIVATIGSVKPGAAKWIAAAVIAVLLVVAAVLWRNMIFGGLSTLLNYFYDVAEEAQAYLYNRPPYGNNDNPEAAARVGIAWVSCIIGFVTALPPAGMRGRISGLVAITVMFGFAYYGLLPSAICIAAMIAVLIAAVSRGNILSFIPVVLAALVLFGAVMLIDPGESYGISRMDENFRDRFALRSALLETENPLYDDINKEDLEEDLGKTENEETGQTENDRNYETYAGYSIIFLIVAILTAAIYLMYRRLEKKRAEIRKGIESSDSREAVTAMFPYAIRWLKGYGIEQTGPSVTSMVPALKSEFSDDYAGRFEDMYTIWSESAYSDHAVPESSRTLMNAFMKDTIKQVKDKCKFKDILRLRFRHAL